MKEKTCIVVTGATAVGKTAFAIELAKEHSTSIISADSRQCYKELKIGVARPSEKELTEIHHYFVASHSIFEEVNVRTFESYALDAVSQIFQTKDIAVMVGGTGLYIKAFTDGLDDIPESDATLRSSLLNKYRVHGIQWLQEELALKDPLFFQEGEISNPQRALRALEVVTLTGTSILKFHSGKKVARPFNIQKINLELPRPELYERINNRVDEMMVSGLLEEVKVLFPYKHLNALQTVGYKELFSHLEGEISLPQAIENIRKNTRHYAKRQITWFKSN